MGKVKLLLVFLFSCALANIKGLEMNSKRRVKTLTNEKDMFVIFVNKLVNAHLIKVKSKFTVNFSS